MILFLLLLLCFETQAARRNNFFYEQNGLTIKNKKLAYLLLQDFIPYLQMIENLAIKNHKKLIDLGKQIIALNTIVNRQNNIFLENLAPAFSCSLSSNKRCDCSNT